MNNRRRTAFFRRNQSQYRSDAFVAVFNTAITYTGSSASNQVKLPIQNLGSNSSFYVDWGDGVIEHMTAWNDLKLTHTYISSGLYTIQIYDGLCNGFSFRGTQDRNKILEVIQWGDTIVYWTTASNANNGHFRGCVNLKISALDSPYWNSSTSADGFFYQATNINGSGVNNIVLTGQTSARSFFQSTNYNEPLDNWDTSTISIFSNIFTSNSLFNQNIGGWDVSSATAMNNFFIAASSFNQDISSWDVSNVQTFQNFATNASSFNPDISSWNVSSATTMSQMLMNTPFNRNLGGWNVSNCSNFSNFLLGVTLSTANYDALLIGWSGLNLVNGLGFHGGSSKYTTAGQTAKNLIIANDLWSFTDGGLF